MAAPVMAVGANRVICTENASGAGKGSNRGGPVMGGHLAPELVAGVIPCFQGA